MNKLQKTAASVISAGALLANTALPIFAATTIEISGNGSESNNDANVNVQTTTVVGQENEADIENNIDADANSGNNSADRNTGGDVEVDTGDTTTTVQVSNEANKNVADVDGCCEADADVLISGNGENSDNNAKLDLDTTTAVYQINDADIENNVDADAKSGNNSADRNTGGDVEIDTGSADTLVVVKNKANMNSARVGNGGETGSLSLRILGNGSESDNDIRLDLDRSLTLTQTNNADIENNVDADANSGHNRAERNTGGEVEIDTGDAFAGVGVDNMANFNWADVDCGCLLDVVAKVAGNGFNSDNDIRANLVDNKVLWQTNVFDCDGKGSYGYLSVYGEGCNNVAAGADTGNNHADRNTGDVEGSDPSIHTGNADTLAEVSNTANGNFLGDAGLSLPDFDFGDVDFEAGFNFAFLMAFLGLSG